MAGMWARCSGELHSCSRLFDKLRDHDSQVKLSISTLLCAAPSANPKILPCDITAVLSVWREVSGLQNTQPKGEKHTLLHPLSKLH